MRTVAINIFFGLGFFLSSCGPKEDTCLANCEEIKKAPQDARDYFLQPAGSWWEYELLDSNIIDTLRMDHIHSFYSDNKCEEGSNVCTYHHNTYLHHSNLDYFPQYDPRVESHESFGIYPWGNAWIVIHSGGNSGISGFGHFLTLPIIIGDKPNSIEATDTTYQLSTQMGTFKTLWLKRVGDTPSPEPKRIINMYLARGIGIVRYELEEGHIWQLKSYKIEE